MRRGFISIAIAFILASTQVLYAGPTNLAKDSALPSEGKAEEGTPTVAEIKGLGLTDLLAPLLRQLVEARDARDTGREFSIKQEIVAALDRFCREKTIHIVPNWDTIEVVPDTDPPVIQIVLITRRDADTKKVLFLSTGEIKEPPVGVETFGHAEARPYIKEVMADPRTNVEEISSEHRLIGSFIRYIENNLLRLQISQETLHPMGFQRIQQYRKWLNEVITAVENGTVKINFVEPPSLIDESAPAIVIKYIDGKLRFISAFIDKGTNTLYTARGFEARRSKNELYTVWLHELSHYFGATEEEAIARERYIIGLEGEVSLAWAKAKQDVRLYWDLLVNDVNGTYAVQVSPHSQQVVPAGVYERFKGGDLPLATMYRRTLVDDNRFGYLYATDRSEEVDEITKLATTIKRRQEEQGKPIRAVVVLGTKGQSLGNRSILEALGIPKIQFLYPDSIGNPQVWLNQLEEAGIKGDEVLLYISSKDSRDDTVMTNMQIFWEWQILSIAKEREEEELGEGLIQKIRSRGNIVKDHIIFSQLDITDRQREILETTLKLMVINTTLADDNPLHLFAITNVVPVGGIGQLTRMPENIASWFSVLSQSAWFTTAVAGGGATWYVGAMREAIQPVVEVFKSENPEENPALKAAIYSHLAAESGKRPILAVVTNDKELQRQYKIQLRPVLEWMQQMFMESLGEEGRAPYLYFVSSQEELDRLAQGEDNIVYLGLNIEEAEIALPNNRPGLSVNMPTSHIKGPDQIFAFLIGGLAQLHLFLEEFTVRYATLFQVNPMDHHPWTDKVQERMERAASTKDERGRIREEMAEAERKPEFKLADSNVAGTLSVEQVNGVKTLLDTTYPEAGEPLENQELEIAAYEGARLMYLAGLHGKQVNPILIGSNNPDIHNELHEHLRRLGQERFARYGGLLWDVGRTDQFSLGTGDNAYTTFIHFVNDREGAEQAQVTKNGLVQLHLNGLTPKEISTLYLEAVRATLSSEGRLNATIRVPAEDEKALSQLKDLFTRMDKIYTQMLQQEPTVASSAEAGDESESEDAGEGERETPEALVTAVEASQLQSPTLSSLVQKNEHTVVDVEKSEVRAGTYLDEVPVSAIGATGVVQSLLQVGVRQKSIFNPKPDDETITAKVAAGWNKFLVRLDKLKALINILMNKKGSFLQRLNPAEPRKDRRVGIYAFRFEDTIAEMEKGTSPGELIVKKANMMIAKIIEQIKESDPEAQFVVFSGKYTQPEMSAVLQHIECGGVFDSVVHGGLDTVREKIRTWDGRLVVASTEHTEGVRSLVVPNSSEGFIPFPELAAIMQELVYADSGPLDEGLIDQLVKSYIIWLQLSEIDSSLIGTESERFRRSLRKSQNLVIHLFIPPIPTPGSVIDLLNEEYKTEEGNRAFA